VRYSGGEKPVEFRKEQYERWARRAARQLNPDELLK